MSLSEVDRQLLDRCLNGSPRAWEDFVDRFLGLVLHVVHHSAQIRQIAVPSDLRDDLVAEVFFTFVAGDYAVLRRFQRNCSLATYLTVIARRVIVRRLTARSWQTPSTQVQAVADPSADGPVNRIENAEVVEQLLVRLDPQEARVVRLYHLQGMSYQQISHEVGLNENSIGPMLSRARDKMRQNGSHHG